MSRTLRRDGLDTVSLIELVIVLVDEQPSVRAVQLVPSPAFPPLGSVVEGAHAVLEMDESGAARFQVRVPAAVALVGPVVLVAFVEFCKHPGGPRPREKTGHVDHVGTVPEQDGPGAAEVQRDAFQFADFAFVEQSFDFPVHRTPAAGVVDGHGHVPAFDRRDHPVGVRQRGRNGLFAIYAPNARRDPVHDDVGVAVVRRHHAQNIGPAGFKHLPVVRKPPKPGENAGPVLQGVLHEVFLQVADADYLRKGQVGIGRHVAVGHYMAQSVVSVDGGLSRPDAAQAHDAGFVCSIVSHSCPFLWLGAASG